MGEGTDVVVVGVATKSQEVAEQMQLYRAGIFNGQVGFGGADVVIWTKLQALAEQTQL